MSKRAISYFINSAGVILAATAIAKLVSSGGNSKFLYSIDPIIPLSVRDLLWVVGLVELGVALILFLNRHTVTKLVLLAWLTASFSVYRSGLLILGHRHCPCMGSFAESIGLSPGAADVIMLGVLIYLLIGTLLGLYTMSKDGKDPALDNGAVKGWVVTR